MIRKIQTTVEVEPTISRRNLSLRVCEWLDWKGRNGKPKEMSCRVALLKLHRRGIVKLPEPHASHLDKAKGDRKDLPVEQIDSICCSLKQLGGVELIRIGSAQSKASEIWNALMGRHHYLGAGPLCGAQMRYLIKSLRYGWLGGLSFSASAWRVEARDRWIGWSDEARKEHLHGGQSGWLSWPKRRRRTGYQKPVAWIATARRLDRHVEGVDCYVCSTSSKTYCVQQPRLWVKPSLEKRE